MLITSDEPWILWELLKPYYYSVSEGKEYIAENFWRARLQLALAGRLRPRRTLPCRMLQLVLPDVGCRRCPGAGLFRHAGGAAHDPPERSFPRRWPRWKDLFLYGGYQLMHVATHGKFNVRRQ